MAAYRRYILDTNVLMDYPTSFLDIKDAEQVIVLPSTIVELELVKEKERGSRAQLARNALKEIEKALKVAVSGVMDNNGTEVVLGGDKWYGFPDDNFNSFDTHLIEKSVQLGAVLVTNDIGLRVRAASAGVDVVGYPFNQPSHYNEARELYVSKDVIDDIYTYGYVDAYRVEHDLLPNEYIVLRESTGSSQSTLARYDARRRLVTTIEQYTPWGVRPKNAGQRFSIDALMNDEVPIVVLSGRAGTGKTYMALAAALEKTLEERVYKKIIVVRPALRGMLGFFPGSKREKLYEWTQGVMDNGGSLLGSKDEFEHLIDVGTVELEDMSLLRGRTFEDTIIIIDEAQNSTPHQIKTAVSRVGANTKIVIIGDVTQIDHPGLTEDTCGLTHIVRKLHTSGELGAHVHLTDSKPRSLVAAWAAEYL